MHTYNFIESFLIFTLFLWFVCLGFALMSKQHKHFLAWTSQSLKTVWRTNWKLIVGIAIGYFLAVEKSFQLTFS